MTSPLLFSFYLSKIPNPPKGISIIQYADDISVYASGTDLNMLTDKLNQYMITLLNYLEERELLVSPEKSTVTLFTPDRRQGNIHPKIILKDKIIPLEKNPKLLGVIFDTFLTFSQHIKSSTDKFKSKANLMKSIAGSDWGQNKENLILTYKALGRSGLEYGTPVWSPIISESNWKQLQIAQNQALRIATGCLAMTGIDHLHQETKVLPIRDHAMLLTEQYVLAMHLPGHPGQKHLGRPPPQRNMKTTAISLKPKIEHCLPVPDKPSYKKGLKRLHTRAVRTTLSKYENNRVIKTKPPEINKNEMNLHRRTRTYLAQLRSGFSRKVNDYMSRLYPEINNNCPSCNSTPHDVNHLFNCPDNPTLLKPIDLWKRPAAVAAFLNMDGT